MPSTVVVTCPDGFTHTVSDRAKSLAGAGALPVADARVIHRTATGRTVVMQHDALVLPGQWLSGPLRGYRSDRKNLRLCSESFVFRWQRQSDAAVDLFTKAQSLDNVRDPPVSREAAVLRWLHQTYPELASSALPVPRVVAEIEEGGAGFLLTESVPGRSYGDLTKTASDDLIASRPSFLSQDAANDAIASCVRSNAVALRQLHDEVSIENCPFECGIASEIAAARARLRAGVLGNLRVAGNDHVTPEQELKRLEHLIPSMSSVPKEHQPGTGEVESVGLDLVFTHGDWCIPNVLLNGDSAGDIYRVAGVVDWGYAGVADRWRDLVKAQWSVGYNYGKEWAPRWLEWYGLTKNERKAQFYGDIANFL